MTGKIVKGIAGFYYVYAEDGITYECKAKGSFRKDKIKPLIGDNVTIDILNEKEGNVTSVLERQNQLIRPEVANINQALIVAAFTNPEPNFMMLDKLILQFQKEKLPIVLVFNKNDLVSDESVEKVLDIYKNSGLELLVTSVEKGIGIDELKELLSGKVTTIAGPSGVGKSSIINSLQPDVQMETGDISDKLKRGKHTTRHSQIIPIGEDTFIIDTPGFTSMDVFGISCENLSDYYEEFKEWEQCFYVPCSHTHEPNCGVKTAVLEDKINKSRYDNYVSIYEEIKRSKKY